jgi:hypothetical protein
MEEETNKLSNEIPADKDATTDEMAAFLSHVGAGGECPICKTDKWIFFGRVHGSVAKNDSIVLVCIKPPCLTYSLALWFTVPWPENSSPVLM